MYLPKQTAIRRSQTVISAFGGYEHTLRVAEGAFYDMENLSSDGFPQMTVRPRRGTLGAFPGLQAIAAQGRLVAVQDGTVTVGGASMREHMHGVTLSPGRKQLVFLGAYLCVFPDGYYFNTEDWDDCGFMAHETAVSCAETPVRLSLCTAEGAPVAPAFTQQAMPEGAQNGDYWLDTSGPVHTLKIWSAATEQWSSVPTVCVKLEAGGIGQGFSAGDGVRVSGLAGTAQAEALNALHTLVRAQDGAIVVTGLLDAAAEQTEGTVRVQRRLPEMDYVTECGNRLWGCRYGLSDGRIVNELYCCRLGDCRNWESFRGTAADSWRAACGSEGPWTGAATLGDTPVFFKEDCIHRIYPAPSGAHQAVQITCAGVQRGSAASIAAVEGRLLYLSRLGVCMYDGSVPVSVSEAFGTQRFHSAAAGSARGKYYISMTGEDGRQHLFVYDVRRGLWHREDALAVCAFARVGDELYALSPDGTLRTLFGSEGEAEGPVRWMAQTGLITSGLVGRQYVTRLNLRMLLPAGASCDVWIEYDSGGGWKHMGHIDGRGLRTFLLPIRPARCDHLRLRLTGRGTVRLMSLARITEAGSDG